MDDAGFTRLTGALGTCHRGHGGYCCGVTTNQPAHEDLDPAALNRETVAAEPARADHDQLTFGEVVEDAIEYFEEEDDEGSPASDADAPAPG